LLQSIVNLCSSHTASLFRYMHTNMHSTNQKMQVQCQPLLFRTLIKFIVQRKTSGICSPPGQSHTSSVLLILKMYSMLNKHPCVLIHISQFPNYGSQTGTACKTRARRAFSTHTYTQVHAHGHSVPGMYAMVCCSQITEPMSLGLP
jgi:hypothetical protein